MTNTAALRNLINSTINNITTQKDIKINRTSDASLLLFCLCYISKLSDGKLWDDLQSDLTFGEYVRNHSYMEEGWESMFDCQVYYIPMNSIEIPTELIEEIREAASNVAEHIIEFSGSKHRDIKLNDNISRELTTLCALFVNKFGLEDIYMPSVGMFSMGLIQNMQDINVYATEKNHDFRKLANMRMYLHGIDSSVLNEEDSSNALKSAKSYLDIRSFLVRRPYSYYSEPRQYFRSLELEISSFQEFLHNENLRKAIIITHSSRLSMETRDWPLMRQELASKGILDTVISLPAGLIKNSYGKTAIWVLNKDAYTDSVNFVALDDCGQFQRSEFTFDLFKAKEIINSSFVPNKLLVTKEAICNNDYKLSPGDYILDQMLPKLDGYRVYELKDLIIPLETKTVELPKGSAFEIISPNDLSYEYDYSEINTLSVLNVSKTSKIHEVESDECCILQFTPFGPCMAKVSLGDKVSKFYKGLNLFAFNTKHFVDADYLLRELTEEYVKTQLHVLIRDITVPTRHGLAEFASLRILLPSLEKQKKRTLEECKQRSAKFLKKIDYLEADFRSEIHMKRHAMGQTIGSINNWWNVLETIRKIHPESLNGTAKLIDSDYSLDQVLENLKRNLKRLTTQIDKLDRGFKYKAGALNICHFIQDYIKTYVSAVFKYDIVDYSIDLQNKEIHFPKEVLEMIFNNILSNASSHGFNNTPDIANTVRIRLWKEDNNIIVSISNNGAPCVSDISAEDLLTYGKTSNIQSHCGIGGYEVKHLMNDFGQKVEVHLNEDREFPVEYRLFFKAIVNE